MFTSDVTPHVRRFCAVVLRGLGVTSTAFPADASPAQLEILFRDRVSGKASASRIKAVLVQGLAPPGMRLPDLAEISRVAHENGAIVVYDNTWMIGWAYDAIAHGADVVVCGGDGALSSAGGPEGVGLVTCTEGRWREVRAGCKFVGLIAAPDDAYKVLRDMRTLPFRMHTQDAAARRLAGFLAAQSSRVENVQHISLPNHPNHRLWQDTCRGAPPFVRFSLSGGVAVSEEQASRFLEALRLVQIGGGDGGWGGRLDHDLARRRSADVGSTAELGGGRERWQAWRREPWPH